MQLTKHSDIALRVLMYLSLNQGQVISISKLSQVYNVSNNHMVKVAHKLVKFGYLNSMRGRMGGVTLAKEPSSIALGEILRKTENNQYIIDCKSANCPLLPSCLLQAALNKAHKAFYDTLDEYTLADLIANKSELLKLVGYR